MVIANALYLIAIRFCKGYVNSVVKIPRIFDHARFPDFRGQSPLFTLNSEKISNAAFFHQIRLQMLLSRSPGIYVTEILGPLPKQNDRF